MFDLAEILFAQPKKGGPVEFGVATDVIICVGMQLRSVGVVPKLLCVVTAERIHFERVPVFLLPPDERSALDE
jgi:hypothetical protein